MNKQQNFSTLENLNGKSCILYSRVSSKEQSNRAQIKQLKEFCNRNGINVLQIFSENISGAAEHREELEKILNSEPLADLLIIREVSRLSREDDYNDSYYKLQQLIKKYSVYILLDNILIEKGKSNLANDITLMVKLYGAADERKKIRDRTQNAKKKYSESSVLNAAYGERYKRYGLIKVSNPNYTKGGGTKKIWDKDPKEWPNVERIFELKSNGLSYIKISNILGLTPETVVNVIKSKTIRYYISQDNPTILEKVDSETLKNNSNPTPTKHQNKYKNKIFYADTNLAMVHGNNSKSGSVYERKGGGISGGLIIEEIIDKIVIMVINFALDVKGEKLQIIKERNKEKIDNLNNIINGLNNTINQKNDELEKLRKKVKLFDDDELLKELNNQINQTKKEIENLKNEIINYTIQLDRLESIEFNKDIIQVNESNFEPFIEKYIDSIRCYHVKRCVHRIDVKTLNLWEDFTFSFEVKHHIGHTITPLNIFDPSLRENVMHLSRE